MFKKDYIFVVDGHEVMSFTRFLTNHKVSFRYGNINEYRDANTKARVREMEIIVHATKRTIDKIYKDIDMIRNYNFGD